MIEIYLNIIIVFFIIVLAPLLIFTIVGLYVVVYQMIVIEIKSEMQRKKAIKEFNLRKKYYETIIRKQNELF